MTQETNNIPMILIKPIHDFDENLSIIGYAADHPKWGNKGKIFSSYLEAKAAINEIYV